ncbi:MAG TPA: OmpA family protein [Bacteroidales bacterium]|jgi:outer membrane protein OmpA-like peptidoglycan-associated protein|nr:OmpA family protein [Bacteroidales bacterium]HOC48279.1 OmpA family protein [Bacteroidales bacterium]HPS96898.1 OmpA family protein [Bacteroidales bacterium]
MKTLIKALAVLVLFSMAINAEAQIKVDLKKKLEQQVNRRLNQKADQAIDKALDTVEDSIRGDVKKDGNAGGNATGQNSGNAQPQGKSGQNADAQSGGQQEPAFQSYSKYDFIPGEKVIFYDDFSQDAVGDFPALWNTNGSAEVVTTNLFPGKWMRFVMNQCVWTDELLKLPENYTIEYDVIPQGGLEGEGMSGWHMKLMQAKNAKAWDGGTQPGNGGFEFRIEYFGRPSYHTWLYGQECSVSNLSGYVEGEQYKQKINKLYHIAIWIQKTRIRVYQDQNKIIDLPRAFPAGCVKPDRIRFEYGAAMISNIRIAVGAPDMRNKLITEGKLVTYGIYFDVNKDVVKPESYGTLKEIATVLQENPDVKVKIVGHTDSDGADASNLDLSKRRGASVKNELVKNFGIEASRLESDGMGESQPVAPNDTPANKALNRRVELIKL